MNQLFLNSAVAGVLITIAAYQLGVFLKRKLKWSLFNPVLIAAAVIIPSLLLLDIDYGVYEEGAKYISYLLTPATICLAVPLYEQIEALKKNALAILAGIFSGVLTSLLCILGFALLFKFDHQLYVTLLPKSITTAMGIGVSQELGGIVTITVMTIIVTGIIGNILADAIFKVFRITHPVAKGAAIGTAAHVIGTSRAVELGQVEGAMSGLAIAVAGLMTVGAAAVFSLFI
ncbi:LrgB family protein [Ihubacter massiliensis]|uniref:LrgB family protein n=1 Tax=Hominibacterium faecale TaxID=2839743 RepID=A0A9J6QT06_9FIRM|nr:MULTISPECIES: LrgB family protein [Eubacteriales Family XIII. Incertae Sedis]MCO7121793.1 LrgB family protein [Ihubacter massiliensis]MCU7377663.1 LrgB family protein [Hominibacterium faecale]MCU7379200.1 LrgB family protein [Hominibacterium faecale]